MSVRKIGDWARARRRTAGLGGNLLQAVERASLRVGIYVSQEIQKGIRSQAPGGEAFKPLAEATLAMRRARGNRGTKALLDTTTMWRGVTYKLLGMAVFVGVLRTAMTKPGRGGRPRSYANVAAVQEFGAIVPSDRSRTGKVIVIPARPFLNPTFRKTHPKIREIYRSALMEAVA